MNHYPCTPYCTTPCSPQCESKEESVKHTIWHAAYCHWYDHLIAGHRVRTAMWGWVTDVLCGMFWRRGTTEGSTER